MPMSGKQSREASFRKAFRTPDAASEAIQQKTGSNLQLVGKDRNDFYLAVDLHSDNTMSCLDAITRHGGEATYATPKEAVGIKTATRGRATILAASGDVDLAPGSGLIFGLDHIIGYRTSEYAHTRTLVITRQMFDTVVAAHFGEGIRINFDQIISFPLMHRLGHVVNLGSQLFLENFSSHPDCVYSASSTRLIREALIVTAAEIYFRKANRAVDSRPREPSTSREQLQKALVLIKTQQAPMSIHDIAAALGVGVRALQIGFKKHVGAPPHFLLRQGRLEGAKRDIEARLPRTVKEVAAKWGFSNVGRFSGEYLSAFGETPYDAIRRARL